MELYGEHAALYDLAFDWDVADEVAWLVERLGDGCRSVLEPGCGPGRLVVALASRGLDVVGVDNSRAMVTLASRRLAAAGLRGEIVLGDMRALDLGRRFDGAVCPVNTLAHLSPDDLARHLATMAGHLGDGARYLVQLDLRDPDGRAEGDERTWDAARGGTEIRVTWSVQDVDVVARRERHRSRIEVLAGAHAGEVLEETFEMTAWTPRAWADAVAASPFRRDATYDGDRAGRPRVPDDRAGPLLWHELRLDAPRARPGPRRRQSLQ